LIDNPSVDDHSRGKKVKEDLLASEENFRNETIANMSDVKRNKSTVDAYDATMNFINSHKIPIGCVALCLCAIILLSRNQKVFEKLKNLFKRG